MPKNEILLIENLRMTSREIAEYCEARHDNVIATIRKLLDKGGVLFKSIPKKYINSQNKQEYIEYECDKTDSIVIVATLQPKYMRGIVERWQYLEKELQTKQALKLEHPAYSEAIQYAIDNSESDNYKKFGFNQENNLIYVIVLGMNAKKFRDMHDLQDRQSIRPYLTFQQAEAVLELQTMNATFLKINMGYDDRKKQLKAYFDKKYNLKLH